MHIHCLMHHIFLWDTIAEFRVHPEHRIYSAFCRATLKMFQSYILCKCLLSQRIPFLLIHVKIRTQIPLKCKKTLIYFFCWQVSELPPTEKRNSVQRWGWGWCLFPCMWISMKKDIRHVHLYPFLILLLLLDVQPVDAQKYQHVQGFGTADIFSCLLVINRKLS